MTISLVGRALRTPHSIHSPLHAIVLKSGRGFISPQNSFRTSRVRQQSTLTKSLEDDIPDIASSPSQSLEKIDQETDLKPFSSLKGAISYDTYKAITVKPFHYTHMTPVQAAVFDYLPKLSEPYDPNVPTDGPRDLLVKAKTGTGKTAAFVIPAIESRLKAIDAHCHQTVTDAGLATDKHLEGRAKRVFVREHAGALIISPTRELAAQIANEALRLSHHHDLEVRLFVGGSGRRGQMRDWSRGRRDIVVGTPGRLRDVLMSEPDVQKGLSQVPLVILDEADTLLDLGFREDVEAIMKYLPSTPKRQTFLFSATVSRPVQQIARKVLDKNHAFINCVSEDSPVHAHVPQYHTVLPDASAQIPHILRLLAHDQLTNPGRSKTVVFFPTTKQTQLFSSLIRELGQATLPTGRATKVYEMHSKRAQNIRSSTSEAFRNDKSGAAILITSDVSARGVDYPGVTRVIQVGMPKGTDVYVHRVGRTGRAGTLGRGDLVLLPWETSFVTWQMNGIPLKSVTINEMQSQVEALAGKFDADPKDFFKGVDVREEESHSRIRSRSELPAVFRSPYQPVLKEMENEIKNALANVDQEAVRETVSSVLGYYIGRAAELRIGKHTIIDGCKAWSVEALGLPTPPYLSEAFLAKLGVQRPRTVWTTNDDRGSKSPTGWTGRGRQGSRPERSGSYGHRSERNDWTSRGRRDSGFGKGDSHGQGSGRSDWTNRGRRDSWSEKGDDSGYNSNRRGSGF